MESVERNKPCRLNKMTQFNRLLNLLSILLKHGHLNFISEFLFVLQICIVNVQKQRYIYLDADDVTIQYSEKSQIKRICFRRFFFTSICLCCLSLAIMYV